MNGHPENAEKPAGASDRKGTITGVATFAGAQRCLRQRDNERSLAARTKAIVSAFDVKYPGKLPTDAMAVLLALVLVAVLVFPIPYDLMLEYPAVRNALVTLKSVEETDAARWATCLIVLQPLVVFVSALVSQETNHPRTEWIARGFAVTVGLVLPVASFAAIYAQTETNLLQQAIERAAALSQDVPELTPPTLLDVLRSSGHMLALTMVGMAFHGLIALRARTIALAIVGLWTAAMKWRSGLHERRAARYDGEAYDEFLTENATVDATTEHNPDVLFIKRPSHPEVFQWLKDVEGTARSGNA